MIWETSMNIVMRVVRRLVYKLGFRPRLGSIFHSPTLHMLHAMEGWDKSLREAWEVVEAEVRRQEWE